MRMRLILVCIVSLTALPMVWANGLTLRIQEPASPRKARCWVTWANGWNDLSSGGNHDAVWLFGREAQTGPLRVQSAAIITGAERFQLRIASDRLGLWLLSAAGRSFERDSALVEIEWSTEVNLLRLCALEMVLIPPGPFWVGDSLSNNTLCQYGSRRPFQIHGDTGLSLNQDGELATGDEPSGPLPSGFPIGTQGFFCMKYEVSQALWADFVNDLPAEDKALLYPELGQNQLPAAFTYKRSQLSVSTSGQVLVRYGGARAMGGLSWTDLLAFLDWACLRPLTETEFEKACRGPLRPIPKEYAWGTPHAQAPLDSLQYDGTLAETETAPTDAETGMANFARFVGLPYLDGPARQGFAAKPEPNRINAGAGYYGCFELSGNVWEQCVRLMMPNSTFSSDPGDGKLASGRANQPGWQGISPIVRGGGHASILVDALSYPYRDLAVSDRFYINYTGTQRRSTTGGRGARGW